jgi:hypothetical protein
MQLRALVDPLRHTSNFALLGQAMQGLVDDPLADAQLKILGTIGAATRKPFDLVKRSISNAIPSHLRLSFGIN